VTRFALGTSIPTKLQAPLRMSLSGGNTHSVLLNLRERNCRDTRQQLGAGQRCDALEDPALRARAGVGHFYGYRVGPKIIVDERASSSLQDQIVNRSGPIAHDQCLEIKQFGIQSFPSTQLRIVDGLELVTAPLLAPAIIEIGEVGGQFERNAVAGCVRDRGRANEGQGGS